MPITNLVTRVRREAARALSQPGRMIVGLSGGADSLCLADALLAEGPGRIVLAHLDHRLRGAASDADAEFVRVFAAARRAQYVLGRDDVAARAARDSQSIELAARHARQEFFKQAAADHAAGAVALAHTADDQAETVLLRLVRGTGIEGLRAMAYQSELPGAPGVALLRPLLRVTRAETMRYCADLGLRPRHDASNDSPEHLRNRVRAELLPLLEQFNPGIRQVLARLADSAASDLDVIAHATQAAVAAVTRQEGGRQSGVIVIDRAAWRALPDGLQRAVLRECVRVLRGDLTNLNFAAIEEARDVLRSPAPLAEIALMSDVRVVVQGNGARVAISRSVQY